jgi:hypothetical protein
LPPTVHVVLLRQNNLHHLHNAMEVLSSKKKRNGSTCWQHWTNKRAHEVLAGTRGYKPWELASRRQRLAQTREAKAQSHIPSKHFSVFVMLCCWQLWKRHNSVVFRGENWEPQYSPNATFMRPKSYQNGFFHSRENVFFPARSIHHNSSIFAESYQA